MSVGKNYKAAVSKIDKNKLYTSKEAVGLLKEVKFAKFDESVDVAFKLGVNPRHADQMLRGALLLPNGTGKSKKVLVFAKGDIAADAEKAGADYVGAEDLVEKIEKGWLDFDVVIATPDMMKTISKLGRILGSRGLMPNPKVGTVTKDVVKAVEEQKKGKVEYRTDKYGIISLTFGRASFEPIQLLENFVAIYKELLRIKPASAKGIYMKSVVLCTTMSPGIKVDVTSIPNYVD